MKILKADASKPNSQYIQHDCPEMNGNIINNDSDYKYMEEFICIYGAVQVYSRANLKCLIRHVQMI